MAKPCDRDRNSRARVAFVLACVTSSAATLAACEPDKPATRAAHADAPNVEAAAARDAGGVRDGSAPRHIEGPAPHAEATPISRRAVREVSSTPFASRAARVGRSLVDEGAWKTWSLTWTPPLTGRVVLQHAPRADAPSDYSVVLDVDHGTRSAQFDHPVDISERAGAVAVMAGSPPAPTLIRLADGQIHTPALRDVRREVLALESLTVRPESADVVVVGRARDGSRFAGLWTNPDAGGVVLSGVLAFEPRFVSGDEATHAVDLFAGGGVPAGLEQPGAACSRIRVARNQRPTCRAFQPTEERSTDLWFGSEWVWRHGEGLINTEARARAPLPEPATQCTAVRALAVPPRLLISCRAPGAPDKAYYLFADDEPWVGWHEAPDAHRDVAREATGDPVLPLDREVDGPADIVVDLEARTLLETSGLRPLPAPAHANPMLSTRAGSADAAGRELIVLDVHAGTAEVIARYRDCPGEIVEVARAGRHVAIACQRQPDPSAFRFVQVWSEVLDLDRRVRWRTPYAVESMLADGRVLVSDRRETAAEGAAWFTHLFVLLTP